MKVLFSVAFATVLAAAALFPTVSQAGPIIYRGGPWDQRVARRACNFGYGGYGYGGYGYGGYDQGYGYRNDGASFYGNVNGLPLGLTPANVGVSAASGSTTPLQVPLVNGSAAVDSQTVIWDPAIGQWRTNTAVGASTNATTPYYQSYPVYYHRGRRR